MMMDLITSLLGLSLFDSGRYISEEKAFSGGNGPNLRQRGRLSGKIDNDLGNR